MSQQTFSVKFLKGTDQLEIPQGITKAGTSIDTGPAYVYEAPDRNVYLYAAKSDYGRKHRYHFCAGDITGAFPTEKARKEYIDMMNKACGEVVAIEAEAA